jgi:tetratricopeptide (TPR) repeat protein
MERLRAQMRGCGAASVIALVNTAAVLISLSRFGLAADVLASIRRSDCDDRALFEIAMLEFVISNRLANAEGMRAAFANMRRAIERSKLPAERLLDASGQAVVWRLKTKAIDEQEFQWFLDLGKHVIAQERGSEAGARSSWYRAVAMIPAAKGDKAATRELMLRARRTAEEALVSRPRAYETHFLKTYHESALKEHMYLTGDKHAAFAEADALIALDPYWSPSYGEKAEAHQRFGEIELAAECYERAGELGPPYVGHHMFGAAQSWERAGRLERALQICEHLLPLDEVNASVVVAGYAAARKLGDATGGAFGEAFGKIETGLSPSHRDYLARSA